VKLWPTTVFTDYDWIADVRFTDGSSSRLGISPHLTEQQAFDKAVEVVNWRGQRRKVVDIRVRRREKAYGSIQSIPSLIRERMA
jgi:hypothetical protein